MRRRRRSSRESRSAQKGSCGLSSVYDYAISASRRTWAPAGAPPRHRDPRAHLPRPARPAPGRRGPRGQPRAAGVHHRRRRRRAGGRGRQLPDRLRLRHRRDVGGNSAPRVAERVRHQAGQFTHTCFMVTPYEGYVAVCEKLAEHTPGSHDKRSALFNSGAEAVENAVKIARHATGEAGARGLRPRLPRPHQPHHGPDRQEHALQGQVRPVRGRDLPGAHGLPAALAGRPG